MDKTALLACIRSFRQEVMGELDRFEDAIIRLGDPQPQQPVKLQAEADDWMTAKQTWEYLKISDSTFYDYIRRGLLPEGIAFGPRTKRWRKSDINAWQDSRNHPSAVECHKPTSGRRGRISRVRKIEEFAYA